MSLEFGQQCDTNVLCFDTSDCCSSFGICGSGLAYCGSGCLHGRCLFSGAPPTPPSPNTVTPPLPIPAPGPFQQEPLVLAEAPGPSEQESLVPAEAPGPSEQESLVPAEAPGPSEQESLVPTEAPGPSEQESLVPTEAPAPSEQESLVPTPATEGLLPPLLLPPSPTSGGDPYIGSPGSGGLGTGAYIGIAIGVVTATLLATLILIFFIRRKRKPEAIVNEPDAETGNDSRLEPDAETGSDSRLEPVAGRTRVAQSASRGRRFTYDELYNATEAFNKELGRGAFGVVYFGTLDDGTNIAVKMLLDSERGLRDFEAEVKTLGSINHTNLVALLGFCNETYEPFLVYEYVSRGSLDKWIWNKADKRFVLPWKTRVEIMKGTAKGLSYLHGELQIGRAIVHLDIKPENILVDENFVPKVADFGLAKLLGERRTHTGTLPAGGTFGYMAPEVQIAGPGGVRPPASPSMDVYSFGIVLLEVLSGRRHLDHAQNIEAVYLPSWAIGKVIAGQEMDVIDPLLQGKDPGFDPKEAKILLSVALLCLQRDPRKRPEMSNVLGMFQGHQRPPRLPSTLKDDTAAGGELFSTRQDRSSEFMINFTSPRDSSHPYKS